MAKQVTTNNIRLLPRTTDFLDRKLGVKGEVFYDQTTNTLRVYDGINQGGSKLAKADLSNVSNAVFSAKATAAGVGGGTGGSFELQITADDSTIRTITSGNVLQISGSNGISTTSTADGEILISGQNTFSTVSVAGQSNVVAETSQDTLTLVAGTNVTITTDASTDTITISAAAGASTNSFATIAVAGQSSVVADSGTDTLTFIAGSGITITTDQSTDSITFVSTAANFNGLTEVTAASLSVDEIYLPAITQLVVTNSGTSAYLFDQYAGNNPTIYAINGTTISFNLDIGGHPFLIQDNTGTNYNTGLVHVSTAGVVNTGSNAQGKTSGTLYWKIPSGISGNYRYQCGAHAGMVGLITIKNFASI